MTTTTRRALRVTTTTHAIALAGYAGNGWVAINYLIDRANATALISISNQHITDLWSVFLLIGCAIALVAALLSPRMPNPAPVIRLEGWGAATMGVCSLIYVYSLGSHYGWDNNATTQAYGAVFGLGGLARVAQIWHENRAVKRALADPHRADPAPLAEARTDDRG